MYEKQLVNLIDKSINLKNTNILSTELLRILYFNDIEQFS